MKTMLNVALPKGRLGDKAYGLFERAGYDCAELREENRKLTFENEETGVRYFWVKPSDVAIYVERGAAALQRQVLGRGHFQESDLAGLVAVGDDALVVLGQVDEALLLGALLGQRR